MNKTLTQTAVQRFDIKDNKYDIKIQLYLQ